jgi:hypothetical protein
MCKLRAYVECYVLPSDASVTGFGFVECVLRAFACNNGVGAAAPSPSRAEVAAASPVVDGNEHTETRVRQLSAPTSTVCRKTAGFYEAAKWGSLFVHTAQDVRLYVHTPYVVHTSPVSFRDRLTLGFGVASISVIPSTATVYHVRDRVEVW